MVRMYKIHNIYPSLIVWFNKSACPIIILQRKNVFVSPKINWEYICTNEQNIRAYLFWSNLISNGNYEITCKIEFIQ